MLIGFKRSFLWMACWALSAGLMADTVARAEALSPATEDSLFTAPTEPVPGTRMIPEWSPTRALAVSVPLEGVFAREGMGPFMLELVTTAARYTDVVVLHDEEQLQTVARVLAGVRERDDTLLDRLAFMPARVGTVWLRDHGPVFGRDAEGRLVVLDAMYRDVRFESRVEQERQTRGEQTPEYRKMALDLVKRRKDDTTPIYLAQYLRQALGATRVAYTRPPAEVWGGDVIADSQGNVFVSTETLTMHGGKQAELDRVLREYYGAKAVIYLEPLPGPTVKHLDMFFKVMDDQTFFLASYDVDPQSVDVAGEYGRYLHAEVGRVLSRNEAVLREAFPDRQIVRLPMPTVVMPTEADVVREYRDLWYTQKLIADTPSLREHLARATDPNDYAQIERKITERAVQQYRIEFKAEPGSDAERQLVDQLIRENSSTNLDEAVCHYAPRQVIYKTYLNSVVIDGVYGKAVLVPGYSPDVLNPAETTEAMRDAVREAYQSALPGYEVVFVNCDTVIELSGALHCVTMTLPRLGE